MNARVIFACFLFLLACSSLHAEQSVVDDSDVVEEITVIGQRSLRSLRKEIVIAEDKFYNLYNSLNDDKDYDVVCKKMAPIGSHILKRTCLPNFVAQATAEEYKSLVLGIPKASAALKIQQKQNTLLKRMEAITTANPELLEALIELSNSKERYIEERKSRFEKIWIAF